jgi:putative ABC transport system substrate-binding protein
MRMNRRDATRALALAPLALGATPLSTLAQQPGKVRRIGYLSQPSRESVKEALEAFLRALRDMGWVDGKNLVIEYRWGEGDIERLPSLAADLVQRKVELIVAPAGSAALAAKAATTTIPIVMIFPPDPVKLGLVASLAHPGGNVTGTAMSPGSQIFGLQLQLLKEAVPRASRIAVLGNPEDPGWAPQRAELVAAATTLGVRLQFVTARGPDDFDDAFAAMTREHADAIQLTTNSTYLVHRVRLAELAVKHRLATMSNFREMVDAGGLMAYSVNMAQFIGRSAVYVDRILRGAKPADLPVEQPTKFELVINLRTAKAIGLALPPALLQRADDLIQ